MTRFLFALVIVCMAVPGYAAKPNVLTFGVVPQQSASKLARLWTPIFKEIGKQTNLKIIFKTAPDIPTFEKRMAAGEYDFSYMNPYHYTVFSQNTVYRAFAKAKDKKIKGIIVVDKNSQIKSLQDLQGKTLAFPSPAAFAASILTRAQFSKLGIDIKPKYVSSHDSVYRTIAKNIYPAGGGVLRTFNNVNPQISKQLKILWQTKGYTPHAFANHQRISEALVKKVQSAMLNLNQSEYGKALLASIKLKGIVKAENQDWNDVRELNINLLDNFSKITRN